MLDFEHYFHRCGRLRGMFMIKSKSFKLKKMSIKNHTLTPRTYTHTHRMHQEIYCTVYFFVVEKFILKQQDIADKRNTRSHTRIKSDFFLFLFILHYPFSIEMWWKNAP